MPHQCLKCGETFQEGSREILRGCPRCGGTRFFYTETPLSAEERERLRVTTEEDMREIVKEILTSGRLSGSTISDLKEEEGWVRLRPRRSAESFNREAVERSMRPVDGGPRRIPDQKVTKRPSMGGEGPEVIKILEHGVYEIDLEALLNRSPLIIERDGTYLIYLPSLFRER